MPNAIPVVGDILGQGISAIAQGIQNRKSREWSEQMYQTQKQDNLNFWKMQNEYNHPAAQAKRLEEAGLNKALMYGKSGSPGMAGPVSTPDVQTPQFRSPNFQVGDAIGRYFDLEIKQAQVDNLRADNAVKLEEAALKNAQTASTQAGTQRSIFDYEFEKGLAEVSADYRRENLRNLRQSTGIQLRRDEREAATNAATLLESAERVLSLRATRANTKAQKEQIKAQIDNIRKDSRLKQLDIDLRKMGIMTGDPLHMRILGRILSNTDNWKNLLK
jgi:hypothetical protein